ncbi:MAG TPA: ATP-binding protein [Polyangiaceae bacterium]|nr:ATP-binding protein [Polyangiaceae bacterium]
MLTQRSIAQAFLALQAILTAMLAALLAYQHNAHAGGAAVATMVYTACWAAFRQGWGPARQVAVVAQTLVLIGATREPYLTQHPVLAIMMPPIIALMLTSSGWIVGSATLGLLGLAWRADFHTPLLEPLNLAILIMSVSGLVLARRSVDVAMARMKGQTQEAEAAREQAEGAAREAIAERGRATKLEAALLHAQRLESVGRLAGGVAHDFNNLLTVIGASTSMAERALATGASPAADLQEVHLAVGRASELTKQLLAFARKQVLVKRTVELNELVSSVDRMLRRVIGERTALVSKLSPEPLRVQADAGQLEQVIVNLVINARDAISDSGRIEIITGRQSLQASEEREVDGLAAGDYAFLEVRDDGTGMTDEVQQRLFEPFFTTKSPGRGTGLGLSTCFGIVRQHDGAIRVDSREGHGTSLRVLLPLASSAEAATSTSGVQPVARTTQRVLVVEDEPQVRAIAARSLTSAGFEVLQAANGALGLALIKEQHQPFDVIVTDVVMPELSGPDLVRAALKLDKRLGIVFMSGFPEAMHDAHASDFGDAAFLAKPFAPSALIEAVKGCLERRRATELSEHG